MRRNRPTDFSDVVFMMTSKTAQENYEGVVDGGSAYPQEAYAEQAAQQVPPQAEPQAAGPISGSGRPLTYAEEMQLQRLHAWVESLPKNAKTAIEKGGFIESLTEELPELLRATPVGELKVLTKLKALYEDKLAASIAAGSAPQAPQAPQVPQAQQPLPPQAQQAQVEQLTPEEIAAAEAAMAQGIQPQASFLLREFEKMARTMSADELEEFSYKVLSEWGLIEKSASTPEEQTGQYLGSDFERQSTRWGRAGTAVGAGAGVVTLGALPAAAALLAASRGHASAAKALTGAALIGTPLGAIGGGLLGRYVGAGSVAPFALMSDAAKASANAREAELGDADKAFGAGVTRRSPLRVAGGVVGGLLGGRVFNNPAAGAISGLGAVVAAETALDNYRNRAARAKALSQQSADPYFSKAAEEDWSEDLSETPHVDPFVIGGAAGAFAGALPSLAFPGTPKAKIKQAIAQAAFGSGAGAALFGVIDGARVNAERRQSGLTPEEIAHGAGPSSVHREAGIGAGLSLGASILGTRALIRSGGALGVVAAHPSTYVVPAIAASSLAGGLGALIGASRDRRALQGARKRTAAAQAKSSHSMHSAEDNVDY